MLSANHLLVFMVGRSGRGDGNHLGKSHLNGIWEMRKAELVTCVAENNSTFQWQFNWRYY